MNRYSNRRFGKDSEEGRVCAANPIVAIDCGNRADHAFEYLVAELALAASGFGALSGLGKSPLHLPNRGGRDQERDQQSDDVPDAYRARRCLLHPVSLVENAPLLRSRIFDELIQFSINIAERCVPCLRVTSAIFGNLQIL